MSAAVLPTTRPSAERIAGVSFGSLLVRKRIEMDLFAIGILLSVARSGGGICSLASIPNINNELERVAFAGIGSEYFKLGALDQ